MIDQIIVDLYEVIERYPNNKKEVLAALKGTTESHSYIVALEMMEANSAMAMNQILGGNSH